MISATPYPRTISFFLLFACGIAGAVAHAESPIPVGSWTGATSVKSYPAIVRIRSHEAALDVSYAEARTCRMAASHEAFDGEFHRYSIGTTDCPHVRSRETGLWVRLDGRHLEYRLMSPGAGQPAETGTLYRD